MLDFIKSLFGANSNSSILKKMTSVVKKINSWEEDISKLSDTQLQAKTVEFKNKLQDQKNLDDLLPEAFAVVREASKRVLGKRHYDVQLIGGIALHNCMISEMMTGEGKTLVSTLPAYLNALSGKSVHIITVNDYLAERDSHEMGKLFNFLGLSVGNITSKTPDDMRKAAYACDITYGTNNEFGFDYLRDNMKLSEEDVVQRAFNFVIIDEVDSILIDEARTPLIISGPTEDNTSFYKIAQSLVNKFKKEEDFSIDEKDKKINFTEEGLENLEKILLNAGFIAKGSLFDPANIHLYHFINQALRANYLFAKETDYIVQNKEVIIIDEFTGRMMEGRRFSDGLHQALEAKENLVVKQENQTLASITFQNYFKMYPKLSGMTGTAQTESKEFLEIYGLKVLSIPSNKPLVRIDDNDKIYLTYKEKERAIVEFVKKINEKGQPILIGTSSIEKSEVLSSALKKNNIKHNVLNAKNHEKEAHIISQAGSLGAVTIATNMAGRGTDIQLGGNLDMMISDMHISKEKLESTRKDLLSKIEKDKQIILDLGGLVVIGTERHESRRIDNQLRGRSGRQGEKGYTAFYISLEDDLMRIFGSNKLEGLLKRLGFKENESISHSMISKSIEKAQKKVETYNFDIRKTLLKFDNVINDQRSVIYDQRKQIMSGDIDANTLLLDNIESIVDNLVDTFLPEKTYVENWDFEGLQGELVRILNIHDSDINIKHFVINESKDVDEISQMITQKAKNAVQLKIDMTSQEGFTTFLKEISLQVLDHAWKRNLLELDYVRGSINLRSYANKDPFNEYQRESFLLFSHMLESFSEQMVSIISHLRIQTETVKEEQGFVEIDVSDKIEKNAPCLCGSGKKYKNCHGK